MKEQIGLLIKLQEKDQQLGILRRQVDDGPRRLKAIDAQLEASRKALETEKTRVHEARKTQRALESDIEDGRSRIVKSKTRLLGVKSNKEYQAVLKEIEETEAGNARIEEKVLGCMEELEELNRHIELREKELASLEEQLAREKEVIEEQLTEARRRVGELEVDRKSVIDTIDPALFAKYEQVLKRIRVSAVVSVEYATCSGCHVRIPFQMYNELQRGDALKFCPHCARIIYWKEPSES